MEQETQFVSRLSVGDNGWRTVGDNARPSVGDNEWRTVGDNARHSIPRRMTSADVIATDESQSIIGAVDDTSHAEVQHEPMKNSVPSDPGENTATSVSVMSDEQTKTILMGNDEEQHSPEDGRDAPDEIATSNAAAERQPDPILQKQAQEPVALEETCEPATEPSPSNNVLLAESIQKILSKLESVSSFVALIPDVKSFLVLVPADDRHEFPRYPRTLAEHLFVARLFEKSWLTEEKFIELTAEHLPEDKRAYTKEISQSTLQNGKSELKWLREHLGEFNAKSKGN